MCSRIWYEAMRGRAMRQCYRTLGQHRRRLHLQLGAPPAHEQAGVQPSGPAGAVTRIPRFPLQCISRRQLNERRVTVTADYAPSALSHSNCSLYGFLYRRAGRLTAKTGGFRRGQWCPRPSRRGKSPASKRPATRGSTSARRRTASEQHRTRAWLYDDWRDGLYLDIRFIIATARTGACTL